MNILNFNNPLLILVSSFIDFTIEMSHIYQIHRICINLLSMFLDLINFNLYVALYGDFLIYSLANTLLRFVYTFICICSDISIRYIILTGKILRFKQGYEYGEIIDFDTTPARVQLPDLLYYIPKVETNNHMADTINITEDLIDTLNINATTDIDSLSNSKGKTLNIPAHKLITSIPPKKISKQLIGAVDIETIVINDKLIPYAIGFAYLKDGKVCEKIFYISTDNKEGSLEARSRQILTQVCTFIELNFNSYTLYAHNLGKFDGYFLLKPLLNHFGPYQLLVDKSRSIISITLPGGIVFKDSLRILPLKLEDLGNLFETEHRKLKFDHTKATLDVIHRISFRTILLTYLRNDCLCLLEVLIKVSNIILEKFEVDLHDCYSTSSLAFHVFRTKYITIDIPTLPLWLDKIIRNSYRGGSVDVYQVIGDQAHYYDVNSLYPHGMCNDIPYKYLGFRYKPNLKTFFGFAYAYIRIPKDTRVPLVPIKSEDGGLFYPTGHMSGIFFSEELKIFIKQGYKVVTVYGYEFSRAEMFRKYVMDIYNLKSKSSGSMRIIHKLLLNGLYGYFGRDPNTFTVKFLDLANCKVLMKTNVVHDITKISEDLWIILAETMPDKTLCSKNSISYTEALMKTTLQIIKTNVAISSAITSYSRVHIAFFKTLPNNVLLYSDTDSVFLIYPLDPKYICSKTLGLMKDELKGEVISEYLFLEPKLYYYKTPNKLVIKARGVKERYITEDLIHKLHRGETVNFEFTQLHKSFEHLMISEKTIQYSLKMNFNRKTPIYNSEGLLVAYKPKHLPLHKILSSPKP